MKARVIASLAVTVLIAAAAAITAVLQTSPTPKQAQPDPTPTAFDQPSIGKDPTAYGPLFKPNKPKPGCNGPNCPN